MGAVNPRASDNAFSLDVAFGLIIIELPFILFSNIIFFIKFRPSIFYILLIVILSILTVFLTAIIGLIIIAYTTRL